MNLIKQIESALISINQARFQDLINHLLHVQGNVFIGAPGSVVAKEKTSKGTPDSFFINDDKFIFVEYTTKEKLDGKKSFFKKLEGDIEHCFNESETAIKKDSIEKIILACTSKVKPNELQKLKEKVHAHNSQTSLEVLDIQNLPLHIYDFPGLSEQYLGVQIIKGEIYNLPDFLIKTTRGLQPSLTNAFIGRDEEIKEALEHLTNVDILLLSGAAGVGKSKLAVAILEGVSKEGYIPIVIQSSAVPLWDDFVHLFQNGKNYVILFDDANKSVQNLSYLLDFVQKAKTNRLKVVITSRDYVKQQVSQRLSDSRYREIIINILKDTVIEEIMLKALPNLQYHYDIKEKIVALAKGNARIALMATYSVTPNAETNYLNSPVLLYEKYFEKISQEIDAFSRPITLQAIAIVSFFGVLDRASTDVSLTLKNEFGIDWDELWTTILELHQHEILDVYANEIVKVSDQVLATYAFYKCFIDEKSAVIDYSKWVTSFIVSHSVRVNSTLIDINNTFNYHHVKDLVLPHLQKILSNETEEEILYSFYSTFWFYKGFDTLLYLKQWIENLPVEQAGELKFTYIQNNHTVPSKYFELLIRFWNYPNELLKPAIELSIELAAKQVNRLPEVLKYMDGYFSYKWEDVQHGYQRQNILLDALLNENRSVIHTKIARGAFLNIIEELLGWHFTESRPSKGRSITISNFDLYNSPELLSLRSKIFDGLYALFEESKEQSNKILEKIVSPGLDFDKKIYVSEQSLYHKLISDKLSPSQYSHCRFVKTLSGKIITTNNTIPEEWMLFINSDIMKLSQFLEPEFEYGLGKTWEENQEEKRESIQGYILSKEWIEIESLLYAIDELRKQQNESSRWGVDTSTTEVFIAIANKGKDEIQKALRLFFGNKTSLVIQIRVVHFILNRNILSGKELFSLIEEYEFGAKSFWIVTLLNALPEEQTDLKFVELLIQIFKNANESLPIHRMLDFLKYDRAFDQYKLAHPGVGIEQHNVISYLTEILLQKKELSRLTFGFHFCQECASYFTNHVNLLKQAFIYLKRNDGHFDHDGKEFEAVLSMDNNFFIEYLEQKVVDFEYLSFRFENFKLDSIWSLSNYKEIVSKAIDIILKKSPVYSNSEHPSSVLFSFRTPDDDLRTKVNGFVRGFIDENYADKHRIVMIMSVVLHKIPKEFLSFLKQFIVLNKDVNVFKSIWLNTGGTYVGSRVPQIQAEIDFCNDISKMIKTIPDILNYAEHLKYIDARITWLKKDIEREQKRDFEDLY